jgi:hypothetical protein
MGAAFPLTDLSISGQLREVAKPEEFRLVLNLSDYGCRLTGNVGTGTTPHGAKSSCTEIVQRRGVYHSSAPSKMLLRSHLLHYRHQRCPDNPLRNHFEFRSSAQ